MSEDYGWTKSVCDNYIFWFKGYVVNTTFEEIARLANISISNIGGCSKDFSNFLSNIRGHYSFIFYKDNVLIAVVDKICTIPLFYTETSDCIIIGNNAAVIKNNISLNNNNLDSSSVLEILMSGYTIGSKTIYRSMRQITAGEYVCLHSGHIYTEYYHTYSPWKVNLRSKSSLKRELTDVLLDVMEKLSLSIKGKQVIVPLSAGYDSRLVASGLKNAGVEDVLCISYGRENSFEVLTAKKIARRLGYEFKHISYNSDYVRNYFRSKEFNKFNDYFDRYSSVEFIQDNLAVSFLHEDLKFDKNPVIINGMTGDYISGGHIPHILSKPIKNLDTSKERESLFDMAMEEYMHKHYNLWGSLSHQDNKDKIIESIFHFLKDRIPDFRNFNNIHAIFEVLEFYGRQSKYVVKGQEAYDYYDYDWRLPLWDPIFIDFWESVPLEYKYSQKLYKEVLIENNWGGVWDNIGINRKTINPPWIRPVRLLFKVLFAPTGKKYWHQFERNVLKYWMDDSRVSTRYPYSRFFMDKKGHRNVVSFASKDYVQKHTALNLNKFL
jgi:asparagine synthase (glutamine-hydrolysing)